MTSSYRPTQIAILRTVAGGEAFVCTIEAQQRSALKLHAKGLLDRDLRLGMARRFIGNEAGTRWIRAHDDALERRVKR